jgi:hypothetical protein
MKDLITSLVRHGLTFGGGFLIAQGLVTADESNSLIAAAVSVVAIVWSIFERRMNKNTQNS